jgi:hypothetical protein
MIWLRIVPLLNKGIRNGRFLQVSRFALTVYEKAVWEVLSTLEQED